MNVIYEIIHTGLHAYTCRPLYIVFKNQQPMDCEAQLKMPIHAHFRVVLGF